MEFSWFENVEIKQIVLLRNRVAERIDVILYESRPRSDLSLRRVQIQKPFKKSTKNNKSIFKKKLIWNGFFIFSSVAAFLQTE